MSKKRIPLRAFFITTFGATILIIIFVLLSIQLHRQAMRDLVREQNEELVAVLANSLSTSSINIEAIPKTLNLFIITENGDVLHQQGALHGSSNLRTHAGVDLGLAGNTGSLFAPASIQAGGEHVIAYAPIGSMALIIEAPWQHALGNIRLYSTLVAPLALIPILLLALFALSFGARQIVYPLQALSQQATALGEGDFSAVNNSVSGIDEIQQLQHHLHMMAGRLQEAQNGLRGYANAIGEGRETERRRLARELHDDTIQSLLVLNQKVQLAQYECENAEVLAQLDEMNRLLSEQITNTRRMIHNLRPTYLEELGLTTALEMLAEEQSADFQIQGTVTRLANDTELALFRITQEALNNSSQHSNEANKSIYLTFNAQVITLTVSDDGVGFVFPDTIASFGQQTQYGLINIQERAQLIGGTADIFTKPQQGTTITITLPAKKVNL